MRKEDTMKSEKKYVYLYVLLLKEVNSGSLLTNNWMTHTEKRQSLAMM